MGGRLVCEKRPVDDVALLVDWVRSAHWDDWNGQVRVGDDPGGVPVEVCLGNQDVADGVIGGSVAGWSGPRRVWAWQDAIQFERPGRGDR